jgi:excisionase family DNA binding protein
VTQDRPANSLTVMEVADRCGVNPETVRRWVREGKLAARRFGNTLFVSTEAIEKMVREKRAARGQ